jgi:hypothetical protein
MMTPTLSSPRCGHGTHPPTPGHYLERVPGRDLFQIAIAILGDQLVGEFAVRSSLVADHQPSGVWLSMSRMLSR